MGLTAAEKILKEHFREGTFKPGNEIGIKIDQTLTQDATGTMVYLQFEAMDIPRVRTELSVSYVDHNTLQTDYRNADDHRFLQSCAKKYGIYFSRPGNGICHQVHLERFGAPGKTLLGSDSHTPTGGGLGALAIGAGGLDIAVAMAGGLFYLTYPEIIEVRLTGKLHSMCSAKDIILTLLKKETVKGGVGKIYEYTGPGVSSLSVPQRATITNMGAELGATTSLFPSDSMTREFLALQKRASVWKPLQADDDAVYAKTITLDLDTVVPMAACPHMPDNVVEVSSLAGKKVDQVAIGSCTNSSITDLGIAADILQGKTIAESVSLAVSPGTKQVLDSAVKAGIYHTFVSSGARILESACGPCIGMGFAPGSKGISLRTFNRNFKGRSGTADASVYLVSPETAAASALTGTITDPRSLDSITTGNYTDIISINDNMIIPPVSPEESRSTEILRGPNIKPCPLGSRMPETIRGTVLIKVDDNITTDHIMPAGAKILPLRSNIPEISKHVFEAVDPHFHERAAAVEQGIIVGGENYGQGSSREHAALAPMYLGVKAVITKSFARIHKANLVNFGILPLVFKNPEDYNSIQESDELVIENISETLLNGNTLSVTNTRSGAVFTVSYDGDGRLIEILLAGGLLNYTKEQLTR